MKTSVKHLGLAVGP